MCCYDLQRLSLQIGANLEKSDPQGFSGIAVAGLPVLRKYVYLCDNGAGQPTLLFERLQPKTK